MPTVRKLSTDEVQSFQTKPVSQRQLVAQEYDGYLAELSPGDYAQVQLGEDENRLTVASRLKAAADRRNFMLHFERSSGKVMRFQVLEKTAPEDEELPTEGSMIPELPDEETPVGSDTPPSEPVRKRGRPPRKQTA